MKTCIHDRFSTLFDRPVSAFPGCVLVSFPVFLAISCFKTVVEDNHASFVIKTTTNEAWIRQNASQWSQCVPLFGGFDDKGSRPHCPTKKRLCSFSKQTSSLNALRVLHQGVTALSDLWLKGQQTAPVRLRKSIHRILTVAPLSDCFLGFSRATVSFLLANVLLIIGEALDFFDHFPFDLARGWPRSRSQKQRASVTSDRKQDLG